MFQLHVAVTSTLLALILTTVVSYKNGVDYDYKDSIVSKNFPQKSDLLTYLKSLRRIIDFCSKHKVDLDMNFEFGLFLINVNLKKVLHNKRNRIPKHVQTYITLLLKENDDLIDFFDFMVSGNHDSKERSNKLITTLFSNETQWMKRLQRFHAELLTESDESSQRFSGKSLTWSRYMENVDDTDRWTPSPKLSDLCMLSLANNEIQDSIQTRCDVYEPCYEMLMNGTDFGYALSHRLLFLLHARHSRGCSIFSKEQDESLTKKFCKTAYSEAEFIANNDYQAVDLLLEQMGLCTLDGHPQFLKRSWLSNVLRFQTKYGCFGQRLTQAPARSRLSRPPPIWKIAKNLDHRIMDGLCDGHVTSVASATLAAAIRYILETYY
ncbi:uncharacterized protein LOC135086136 [Ostrinia nubilalis]|uniref:uncharacterized protein LOC135086136 n=1 Tax=Ostrinia nubilalis TaxID=29057 RepID=UPI00308228EE